MKDKSQTAYLTTAEELLNLPPALMARSIGLPYDSYKDLKNGRRTLRPIHRRVIELLKVVECGGVKDERRALNLLRKEFASAKVERAANARAARAAALAAA